MRSAWLCVLAATLTLACGDRDAVPSPARGGGGDGDGGSSASAAGSGGDAGGHAQAGAGGTEPDPIPYPDPDWPEAPPETQGLDSAQLEVAADIAGALDSYCLLVIRNGQLVFERYFGGHDRHTPQKSFSVAKSYTSALVGIAIGRGDIAGVDQSAADFIPEWQGTSREAITIAHLLSMTSGLHWDLFSDYVSMVTLSDDHSGFAVGLAHDGTPGEGWTYHNGAVQIFEPLWRAATGMDMEAYAQAELWSRIGMSQTHWATDPSGHPTAYASVMATCRDHARFGYLYRHGGAWKGEQIIPASYVAASLIPSQSVNRAYGRLWWLNGETPAIGPLGDLYPGQLSDVSPGDAFLARGFGSQFIEVIPSQELIIVRFGKDPVVGLDFQALFDDQNVDIHDSIVGAVLDALD